MLVIPKRTYDMEQYFALYMAPVAEMEKMMASSSPEDMQSGMDEWSAWMEAHQDAIADMGAPLGKTKRVTAEGISDVKNEVGGYSIVQASSHEEAAALLQDSPHFQIPGAYIDVIKVMPMEM